MGGPNTKQTQSSKAVRVKSGQRHVITQQPNEIALWHFLEHQGSYGRPEPGRWFYVFSRLPKGVPTLVAEVEVSSKSRHIWYAQLLNDALPTSKRTRSDRTKYQECILVPRSTIDMSHEVGFFHHYHQLSKRALGHLLNGSSLIDWVRTDAPMGTDTVGHEGTTYDRLLFSIPDPYRRQFDFGNRPVPIRTVVCVIRGYDQTDPEKGGVIVGSISDSGLQRAIDEAAVHEDVAVLPMRSSNTESTKKRLKDVVDAFRGKKPSTKIVMIGHSMGGDNIIEFAKAHRGVDLDLIITLDIMDYGVEDDDVYGNVKRFINYHQESESAQGEVVDIQEPGKTKGVNKRAPGSVHTSIDGDLRDVVAEDVVNFLEGRDAVKLARKRDLNEASPTDKSVIGNIMSNMGASSQRGSESVSEFSS